jgi:predicted RNA binding protein YcfA (HicA-like mRNA interferase family)
LGEKGSHVRLKKKASDRTYIVVVPLHPELKKGLSSQFCGKLG